MGAELRRIGDVMSNLIVFGVSEAKKIAAEKAAKFPELGDLAWHEKRASVDVYDNEGEFVVDFDGTGFVTRVYADGKVRERGVVSGRMGWLPC